MPALFSIFTRALISIEVILGPILNGADHSGVRFFSFLYRASLAQ